MKKSEIGEDEIGKLGGFVGDGRDGRFPWWRVEEGDREEGEGRDEAFSVEEGGGMFS